MARKRNPCRGKRFFESKKSSSYIAMNGTWGMKYRPDGAAKGFFGNDTFRFGDSGTAQLVVPGAKFGQANEIDEALAEVAKITAGKYVYRYEADAFADTSSSFIGTTSYNAKEIASRLNAKVTVTLIFEEQLISS
ncbi:hypothetical protein ANCDUO_03769 [Ancylostoma duodenale]|uniref:Peptidase A1 domain-containing protein n=1 Tax=Ancylostoma duodenale TaxID=51022 RepID=A0A0C2H8P7_9BILA|nr:hypothetical protein ANCDUO_03769 [Ancylostoma duodenale]